MNLNFEENYFDPTNNSYKNGIKWNLFTFAMYAKLVYTADTNARNWMAKIKNN